MTKNVEQLINQAVALIRKSKFTTVLTGAGISTPSGIPDFRSSDSGLWSRYDPFEVASLTTFRYNPEKFFNWMRPLAVQMYEAEPNAAHISLERLEKSGFIKAIITQNIDSLHYRAGSKNVIEVHGSMRTMTCRRCFHQVSSEEYITPYLERGEIPRCSLCTGILKPDVILMEEQLPIQAWNNAVNASRQCDLMIVIGSSLQVVPAANLPMQAIEHGAHLIIVNKSNTYADTRADVVIHEDLIEVIPVIVEKLMGE